jgi:hypothetical protein
VVLPERKGWFETILDRQEEESVEERAAVRRARLAIDLLPPEVADLVRWALELSERGPIARLPFELRFH